ncbi:hypothetical protein Pmani_005827 [Petrolisthes manimaculis]|uniref:uS12 prolyl 3-hydroxylase n=1 Tax=Petrolisthes manimaculis TaxID=1843537 RepID=A0AAE1QBG0_9EUCA|nr:hypothetical protein Pmani_005827 [Petrolisthes manimaculis]
MALTGNTEVKRRRKKMFGGAGNKTTKKTVVKRESGSMPGTAKKKTNTGKKKKKPNTAKITTTTTTAKTNSKKRRGRSRWRKRKTVIREPIVNVATTSTALVKPESATCSATNTTSGAAGKRKRRQAAKKRKKIKLETNCKNETQDACVREVILVDDNNEGDGKKMKIDASNALNAPKKMKIEAGNALKAPKNMNIEAGNTLKSPKKMKIDAGNAGNTLKSPKKKKKGKKRKKKANINQHVPMMGKGGGVVANITPKLERSINNDDMRSKDVSMIGKDDGVVVVENITPKLERSINNDVRSKDVSMIGKRGGGGVANITPKVERINNDDMRSKDVSMIGKEGGGGVANITPKLEKINDVMIIKDVSMMGKRGGGGVANITPKVERINNDDMKSKDVSMIGKDGGGVSVANITPKLKRINDDDMRSKDGSIMGKEGGGGVANITPKLERINEDNMINKNVSMIDKEGDVMFVANITPKLERINEDNMINKANITPKLESIDVEVVEEEGTGKNTPTAKKKTTHNNKDTPIQQRPEETVTKKMNSSPGSSSRNGRPMGISNSRPDVIEIPSLNVLYAETSQKETIRTRWNGEKGSSDLKGEVTDTVIEYPFTCVHLSSFLSNPDYLDRVYDELLDLKMISKNNDLYKFQQSNDLKTVTSPHLAELRCFLFGEFREWLIQVTGIPLTPTVDMSCSQYQYTDVLLCHDDELEGRRVAFILYLVPPWSYSDGGTLDFFDVDGFGQPLDVVHSIVPQRNSFAFFEVSPISFHQVSEVVSQKKRVSINGWFHGPPIKRPNKVHLSPRIQISAPMFVEEEEIYAWINPQYLEPDIQHQVRKEFAEKSALELDNFFTTDCFDELAQALQSSDLPWTNHGPANRQSYQSLEKDDAPEVVKSVVKLLHSEAMFLILSQLTGLKLHSLAPPDSDPDEDEDECGTEPNPRGSVSIKQWRHRSYTLVRDDCLESKSVLDAHMFVNVPKGLTQEHGGFISYLAKDEDEELLTVVPRENCLALVYRDAETLTFTKYINHRVTELAGGGDASYQTLNGVYYE